MVTGIGLFSRGNDARRPGEPDEDESLDHQGMAIELIDGFAEHDAAAWATNNAWHEMNYTTSRVMKARRDREEVAGETADA